MSDEEWLPVPGHPNYEVSDLGRVRSSVRNWSTGEPRLLAICRDEYGYRMAQVSGRSRRVHILVAAAFIGPRPEGMTQIRHLDGNNQNNSPTNLAYGTHSENQRDAVAHGAHGMTKRTHCPEGHEYDILKPGHRQCKRCKAAALRRWRARQKASA